MTTTYTHILDLAKEAEPPADGIVSRTIFQDDWVNVVVFGFGQGQELSEHTAANPAMLFFVKGEARVGLGDDVPVHAPTSAGLTGTRSGSGSGTSPMPGPSHSSGSLRSR